VFLDRCFDTSNIATTYVPVPLATLKVENDCEISSSRGGEYEAQNLLGCAAVFIVECRPTFQKHVPLKRRSTFN
jgi:hypothetical protein